VRSRGRVGWIFGSPGASETAVGRAIGGRAKPERRCWTRPTNEVGANSRHRFDDPGAGPSHAPQGDVGRDLEDFRRQLEVVL